MAFPLTAPDRAERKETGNLKTEEIRQEKRKRKEKYNYLCRRTRRKLTGFSPEDSRSDKE